MFPLFPEKNPPKEKSFFIEFKIENKYLEFYSYKIVNATKPAANEIQAFAYRLNLDEFFVEEEFNEEMYGEEGARKLF